MKLKKIELLSDDLEATQRFYTEVLQFHLNRQNKDLINIQCGYTQLVFHRTENPHPVYHFAFNIPANFFDEAKKFLSDRVPLIPVIGDQTVADFINWNAKSVYFRDTTGNILEFITRFNHPVKNKKEFRGTGVISVCEIGLAAENVTRYTDELMSMGIQPYSKQPRLPDFAAMGDDEGLLIVSSLNRNWYPTAIPSAVFETKVHLEMNGKKIRIDLLADN